MSIAHHARNVFSWDEEPSVRRRLAGRTLRGEIAAMSASIAAGWSILAGAFVFAEYVYDDNASLLQFLFWTAVGGFCGGMAFYIQRLQPCQCICCDGQVTKGFNSFKATVINLADVTRVHAARDDRADIRFVITLSARQGQIQFGFRSINDGRAVYGLLFQAARDYGNDWRALLESTPPLNGESPPSTSSPDSR